MGGGSSKNSNSMNFVQSNRSCPFRLHRKIKEHSSISEYLETVFASQVDLGAQIRLLVCCVPIVETPLHWGGDLHMCMHACIIPSEARI